MQRGRLKHKAGKVPAPLSFSDGLIDNQPSSRFIPKQQIDGNNQFKRMSPLLCTDRKTASIPIKSALPST